ncbi:amidohydrolase family protein [Nocardioides hankookensis]|uniref:Amidohydrolase family protein n=1 Tax=Nocardioides hankookensis TaxID=443157 RepID=A0ABW1LJV3_9ACTN
MDLLTEHVEAVRLVDHHVHGWFTEPGDLTAFAGALNEGSGSPMAGLDLPVGLAVRRWCAPLLGLEPHASAEDYWAARSATPYDVLVATFLEAAGVEHWVVDTGLTPDLLALPDPRSEIVRLELLLEEVRDESDVPGAFRARLDDAARRAVGTKTIAAYRCGLDIDWSRPTDAAVAEAARRSPARVADPVLVAFGVHEAAARGLPIQVHTGLGDRDLDLHRADPLHLLPLIRSIESPVLLLHCYPFHRQAGYLAQAFDHVSFDVGLAINHLGARSVELVAESLELAPFGKQLYSSDAYGLPELHYLGARLWRRAMVTVLGGWVERGDCSVDDAMRIVDLVASGNARRVYALDRNPEAAPRVLPL